LDWKDIIKTLDVKDAISETIKAIPDLFVSAGVPVALGTGATLLTGFAVAPSALLALGCGIAAHNFPRVMSEIGGRLSNRRRAQFLAYPLQLRRKWPAR